MSEQQKLHIGNLVRADQSLPVRIAQFAQINFSGPILMIRAEAVGLQQLKSHLDVGAQSTKPAARNPQKASLR